MQTLSQNLIKQIPSSTDAFKALLKADFKVQWRQRRAFIMSLLVPVIFVISWKSLIPAIGGAGVLSICIAIGLPAIGLMGYSMTVARDRDRGVFQRLRAAPIPTWAIMTSRIVVQVAMIVFMTAVTCLLAYFADGISFAPISYILVLIASALGSLAFLGIGQFVVASFKSSESVSAAARLIYFPIAIVGALGEVGIFGDIIKIIVVWSPLGTAKTLLVAAMTPGSIDASVGMALVATLAYGIVFAGLGIRRFKWTSQ